MTGTQTDKPFALPSETHFFFICIGLIDYFWSLCDSFPFPLSKNKRANFMQSNFIYNLGTTRCNIFISFYFSQ